ncbi:MAG: ATP-grasp fold amidoligase family protein [Candidatus Egerieousia sp.]
MRSAKSIWKAISHPRLVLGWLLGKAAPHIHSDRMYIRMKYRLSLGHSCNFKVPKTFQDKLQWIKLNDHKPIYHQMVDKYDAKKFIEEKVGKEYVIPTIGLWDNFEDIDFDKLPNEFIIKNTHDSGTYFICKDKSACNIDDLKFRARKKLLIDERKHDYYVYSREWPYKGLRHRIIAEPLINDGKGDYLTDYKFYTFNGEPKFFYVTSNRGCTGGLKEDFFDVDGNLMMLNQKGFYNNPKTPILPINLSKMIELSRILAENTYHLRVDFYETNDKMYVGELTFFDGGGFCAFTPEKYNRILGDWIKLPIDKD